MAQQLAVARPDGKLLSCSAPQPWRHRLCAQPTLNQTENLATARISGSAGGRTQGDPPARLLL